MTTGFPSTMPQTISSDYLTCISTIINCSITSGHVPMPFKRARVILIPKKPSDPSDISNYQLVSVVPFLSTSTQFLYFSQNNFHDPNLSVFKMEHCTENAFIAVTTKLHATRLAKLSSVLLTFQQH